MLSRLFRNAKGGKPFWTRFSKEWVIALVIAHLIFFSLLVMHSFKLFQRLELNVYDELLVNRPHLPADERITMIWITDDDQRQWNWPLLDTELAQLMLKLAQYEPKLIGLDIYRDTPVPRQAGSGYDALARVLLNNHNIVVIKNARVSPPPVLVNSSRVTNNDVPYDIDNIIRRGLLYVSEVDGSVWESFSLKLANVYLADLDIYPQPHPTNPYGFKLGEALLAPLDPYFGGYSNEDTGGFQIMLTYPDGINKFDSLTISDVLHNRIDPNLIRDHIVIIGVDAYATPDQLTTPISVLTNPNNPKVPGAEVHARLTSQLLRMALGEVAVLHSWQEWHEFLWLWFWCVLGVFVCLYAHSLWQFSLAMVMGLVILTGTTYIAFLSNLWIPLAITAIGWVASITFMMVYLSYQEKSQRGALMQIFSKHVSKEVAEVIWQEREQYLNEGRLVPYRLTATVLFTDLQNFTTISENMEPQELMDWLNGYMSAMVEKVQQHHGQVNKFIGDAVMAVFGVPIPRVTEEGVARDAINAVECALAMRETICQLREEWQKQGMPLIRMRIGIYTGLLVAGSLGGRERQEYTVIGDTVNTASRLESYDKTIDADTSCRILIGQSTLQYIQGHFETERVGAVQLKGKAHELEVYRVMSRCSSSCTNN